MHLRILLVDDHEIVRLGLKALLSRYPHFEVIAEARDAQEALEQTVRLEPDIVVMDIRLPGKNGIEATRDIVETRPETKVIMLTDHRKHPDWVTFDNLQQQRAAFATATADLIGQMANREYLERVLFLYYEFEEAQMGGFADIHDLLEKTTAFYRMTKGRLDQDLNGMSVCLARHFGQQAGAERNFYQESISRNLDYLERVVATERVRRLEHLKRGGVVEKVLELKGTP